MSDILKEALVKKGSPAPGQYVRETQLFRNRRSYGKNRCGSKLESSLLFSECPQSVPMQFLTLSAVTHMRAHTHIEELKARSQ